MMTRAIRLRRQVPKATTSQHDTVPERTVWAALWLGLQHFRLGLLAALVAAWSGVIVAVYAAGIGAVLGGGAVLVAAAQGLVPSAAGPYGTGIGNGITIIGVLAGALAGAVTAFTAVFGSSIVLSPQTLLAELITGALIAVSLTAILYRGERLLLAGLGYRRMAWDEWERIAPLAADAARDLGLWAGPLPHILIADTLDAHAWTQMRAIVITRGLLDLLDDDELRAVMAHELYHWSEGHPVGQRLLWACALPLVPLQALALWLGRSREGVIAFIAWCLFWPIHLTIRVVVAPVFAHYSRSYEFLADAGVATCGPAYREGLRGALAKIAVLEAPRTGWEATLTRAHPPTPLRLERLVSPEEVARRAAQTSSGSHRHDAGSAT